MKNNLIYFYDYIDAHENVKAHTKSCRDSNAQKWLTAISDSVITLAISVCTIFCIYLAYTML